MDTDPNLTPIEESDASKRTIILATIGIIVFGICALFALAFFWFWLRSTGVIWSVRPAHTRFWSFGHRQYYFLSGSPGTTIAGRW